MTPPLQWYSVRVLAPIVQRRPFPAAFALALGILLYGVLLLNLLLNRGESVESLAAAPQEIVTRQQVEQVEAVSWTAREVAPIDEASALKSSSPQRNGLEEVPEVPPSLEKLPLENLRGRLVDELGSALQGWQVQPVGGGDQAATTSTSGKFELKNVEQGEYALLVWNAEDLRSLRTAPLATTASPTEVNVLICDVPRVLADVEGVIRTKSGRRLRDVFITPVLPIPQGPEGAMILRGTRTVSLDEGRFRLQNFPQQSPANSSPESEGIRLLFWITGGGVLPSLVNWNGGDLVAVEGAEFIIELGSDSEWRGTVTHLVCRDENGLALPVVLEGRATLSGSWELPLAGLWGTELRCRTSLEAYEIVLGGKVEEEAWSSVTRRKIWPLSPDRTTRVRFR